MTEFPGPDPKDIQKAGGEDTEYAPKRRRQPRRIRSWIEDHRPVTGERKTVDNPFGVKVPDRYAEYAPLIAVESGLIKDFSTYYAAQLERSKRENTSVNLRPQQAFNQELRRFVTITREVSDLARSSQGSHARIRVFSDLDESAGSVIERKDPIRLPGYPDLRYEDMTPAQQSQHRELCVKSIYEDFAFSPGYVHALNWLHDTLGPEPGITFGVLSTKPQSGMSQHLMPTLEEVIPNAFNKDLILSSSPRESGAVDFYIPEIAEITKDPWQPPTLRQAFNAFIEASPLQEQEALRQLVKTYPKGALRKPLSDFDIKLFIIVRIQQQEKMQIEDMYKRDLTPRELDEEVMIPPETKDVLLDDVRVPKKLFPSVKVVKLDRWRQIDEKKNKPIPKKASGEEDDSDVDDILSKFSDL